mgnify:FL=1
MTIHSDILEYNAAMSGEDKAIGDALAKAIDRGLAKVAGVECTIWHRHPVWFIEGNPIVGYSKLKHSVRLLFWSGQSFDEPGLGREGSFKAAEARYASVDEIDTKALARWLKKSIDIQWDYKNIVKRQGRLEWLKREPRSGTGAKTTTKKPAPTGLQSQEPESPTRKGAAARTAPRARSSSTPTRS